VHNQHSIIRLQDKLQTLEAELYHASLRSRMEGLGSGGEGKEENKGKTSDATREAANAELEAVVSKVMHTRFMYET
jgi:hypothetical protein